MGEIKLRKVTTDDARLVFDIRNEETVRKIRRMMISGFKKLQTSEDIDRSKMGIMRIQRFKEYVD